MTPWTPKKLADLLGISAGEHVRRPLRERAPGTPAGGRWYLNRDDVAFVGERGVDHGLVSSAKAAEVLEQFDLEHRDGAAVSSPFDVAPPEFTVLDDEGPVRREAERLLSIARNGGSVLADHDVWTDQNIEVIVERFVKQPDVSGADFFTKLETQLSGVDDDVRVFFAEVFILQMLPLAQFLPERKIGNIERVLEGADAEYSLPPGVIEAFGKPVFGGGQAFSRRRFHQLSMLIEFIRYIRTLSEEEWDEAMEDPMEWRHIVMQSPGSRESSLRAGLTYLGHPEYFFPIVSESKKKEIVEGFYPQLTGRSASGDADVDLAVLREWMSPEVGMNPNFHEDPLASCWMLPSPEDEGEEDEAQVDEYQDVEPEYTVDSIVADGAFHSVAELRSIITRWRAVKNVILQGPPGTGKTWLARRLAFALIGLEDEAAVRSVQFHPGTSYEDFVRGWRPGGDGTLTLVDGPLLQHAERARENPDVEHVLIIEEFNRGNPAQALGEMLTLLESTKRTQREALELTYMRAGESAFHLPENLYVIGTMNTADRSLALVDFALRRRFSFFTLEPQVNAVWVAHLKDRFRTIPGSYIDEAARRVRAMNEMILSDPGLGPSFQIGHSFFVPEKEASEFEPWFRSVVDSSVAPQLVEYWHNDPETVDRVVNDLRAGF